MDCYSIFVTGGRAGLGRSQIAANLAIALQQHGHDSLLLDLDLGRSELLDILGVAPTGTLSEMLSGRRTLDHVITEGPGGIRILSGGPELERLAWLSPHQEAHLLGGLQEIEETFDFVIADVGAGVANSVMTMVLSADEVLALTTPEPAVLDDAYAALRMAGRRNPGSRISLCVNRVNSSDEGQMTAMRLNGISRSFLNTEVAYAGSVHEDVAVDRARSQSRAVLLTYPTSRFAKDIKKLALNWSTNPDLCGGALSGRLADQLDNAVAAG